MKIPLVSIVTITYNHEPWIARAIYSKAPFYKEVMPLLHTIFSYDDKNLGRFLWNSYKELFKYIEINTNIVLSSEIKKDCLLKGKEKVLNICHSLGADTYYNAIGGQELYDKEEFKRNGIDLYFVKTTDIKYFQIKDDAFEPNLSIIDVLMFNGKEGTKKLLNKYTLV